MSQLLKQGIFAALLACLLTASTARADECDIRHVDLQQPGAFTYLPFAQREQSRPLRLRIESQGNCALGIGLLANSEEVLKGSGGVLRVAFINPRGLNLSANGKEIQSLSFVPAGNAIETQLNARIDAKQVLPAGQYSNTFTLRLFEGGRPVKDLDFTLSANVASQAELQLAGNSRARVGSSAGLDFGVLSKGKTQMALLSVMSNSAYSLAVSSENGGVLQHVNGTDELSRIAYLAWLDNQLLSLSQAESRLAYDVPQSGARVSQLKVQIGETEMRRAGEYRDTLRVTLTMLD